MKKARTNRILRAASSTSGPELLEIFDSVQTGTPVRDVSVKIVLLARHLVDRDALENQVFREPRFDWARF